MTELQWRAVGAGQASRASFQQQLQRAGEAARQAAAQERATLRAELAAAHEQGMAAVRASLEAAEAALQSERAGRQRAEAELARVQAELRSAQVCAAARAIVAPAPLTRAIVRAVACLPQADVAALETQRAETAAALRRQVEAAEGRAEEAEAEAAQERQLRCAPRLASPLRAAPHVLVRCACWRLSEAEAERGREVAAQAREAADQSERASMARRRMLEALLLAVSGAGVHVGDDVTEAVLQSKEEGRQATWCVRHAHAMPARPALR